MSAGVGKRQGAAVDDNVARGMRAMGASWEQIARAGAVRGKPTRESAFEVHFDAWDAFCFFLKVRTQWVYAGWDGVRVGLNFSAITAMAEMWGIRRRKRRALLDDLVLIESAVLDEDRKIAAERPRHKRRT